MGRVDDAQRVGRFGVVGFVEIFIQYLKETLLFMMVSNGGRLGFDGLIIGLDFSQNILAGRAREKCPRHLPNLAGDIVILMKFRLLENRGENIFSQYMLNNHFPNIGQGNIGVDGLLASFMKGGAGIEKSGTIFVVKHVAQGGQQIGQIGLKAGNGLPKRFNMGRFVADKGSQQSMEARRVQHVHPQKFVAVAVKDGRLAILKKRITGGIAFGDFLGNFLIKQIMLIFAFPIAPILAQGIL